MVYLKLVLIVNLLLVAVKPNTEDGYCDAITKTCKENDNMKYLLYDVNSVEGFNLRRDVYMRFAIMFYEAREKSNKLHWNLVLPPWYNLYHWKSGRKQPVPWNNFFDMSSLKSFAPVVDMYELFAKYPKNMNIDTIYVLQNYDDPFENGSFVDKWEISGVCELDHRFWGYQNITFDEIVCVKFQGKTSQIWELLQVHPNNKIVMIHHGEIPLHDHYGTKMYWDCRKSMKFNENLLEIADDFIRNQLKCTVERCDNYVSIHWRRQDFSRLRSKEVPSINGTIKQINTFVKKNVPSIKNIFVATDSTQSELSTLENGLTELGYKVYYYTPKQEKLAAFKDGGVAIIDQIICSHAVYFIGTHESTFTYRIQEEREILGFDSKTTFNRLCPDTGKCEKPSQWKIVN